MCVYMPPSCIACVFMHVCACGGGRAQVPEVDQKGRSTGRSLRTKVTTLRWCWQTAPEARGPACPLCRPAKCPSCQSGSWFPSGRDCEIFLFPSLSPFHQETAEPLTRAIAELRGQAAACRGTNVQIKTRHC